MSIKLTYYEVHALILKKNYRIKLIGCIDIDSETTTLNAERFALLIGLHFRMHFVSSIDHIELPIFDYEYLSSASTLVREVVCQHYLELTHLELTKKNNN